MKIERMELRFATHVAGHWWHDNFSGWRTTSYVVIRRGYGYYLCSGENIDPELSEEEWMDGYVIERMENPEERAKVLYEISVKSFNRHANTPTLDGVMERNNAS